MIVHLYNKYYGVIVEVNVHSNRVWYEDCGRCSPLYCHKIRYLCSIGYCWKVDFGLMRALALLPS